MPKQAAIVNNIPPTSKSAAPVALWRSGCLKRLRALAKAAEPPIAMATKKRNVPQEESGFTRLHIPLGQGHETSNRAPSALQRINGGYVSVAGKPPANSTSRPVARSM
jgi:hypothetical protein